MSSTDTFVANAERYAAHFDKGDLPMPPASHVLVVACMDARLSPYGVLGLSEGDAQAVTTPIGYLPAPGSLDLDGLEVSWADLALLLTVDPQAWKLEAEHIPEYFQTFHRHLPARLWELHRELVERLGSS